VIDVYGVIGHCWLLSDMPVMALARHSFVQCVWISCSVDMLSMIAVVQECCKQAMQVCEHKI